MSLSSSAQKVQDALNNLGYDYRVIEFKDSTRTAQDAAQRLNCEVGQIVKSLIFKGKKHQQAILILTSGANQVDVKRMRIYTDEKIERADPAFVRECTGYAIGGIPPLGHLHPIHTYIDEDLLQYEKIWAAAGTPNAVFELDANQLAKMTAGKVVSVKK